MQTQAMARASSPTTSRITSRRLGPARYLALALALGSLLTISAGCDEVAKWRDAQIQTSHQLGQGSQVTPPAQPIELPERVKRELPLDPSFTILSYQDKGDGLELEALSAWDTTTTAQWMLAELANRGYDSGDNASRILEGVTYSNAKARYQTLHVQVTLNTKEQCLIQLRAWKEAP